jgi:transposase
MEPFDYFNSQDLVTKKKYDALRDFYYSKESADAVAQKYGYTRSAFYSLTKDFRRFLSQNPEEDYFFKDKGRGRKHKEPHSGIDQAVIDMRKKNYSTEDILRSLQATGNDVSYQYVYKLLRSEGFAKLPRRNQQEKASLETSRLKAPVSEPVSLTQENFLTSSAGLLCFLPYINKYGIDQLIEHSGYPSTKQISTLSSIMSFLALKLNNIRRYSCDDLWCMDRGGGLFAGLNVLPKNAWFSSYSHRVTREDNLTFLKSLHQIWSKNGLLSDTSNLDFTTIPYWGEDDHLENNWSGKRGKALSSMLAVLAQDPDSGIINYGDADVMHKNESAVVLEYLDFYKQAGKEKQELKYLIFDSKFTNYENLSRLDDQDIKFVTIRRRGKKVIEEIESIPSGKWSRIRVEAAGLKKRTIRVYDDTINLPGYKDSHGKGKPIRQVAITGHGKIKPALIITNDFEITQEVLVRKYTRRWLVEKGISEQIEFFHLNRVSSSMVIKVDFDLVMTILAHNIYRLFALDLDRYAHQSDERIYEKFVAIQGKVSIDSKEITVDLKKRRDLPLILETMSLYEDLKYDLFQNRKIRFTGATTT